MDVDVREEQLHAGDLHFVVDPNEAHVPTGTSGVNRCMVDSCVPTASITE
jgi:hypothetical protein